jgi:hypothetical protein
MGPVIMDRRSPRDHSYRGNSSCGLLADVVIVASTLDATLFRDAMRERPRASQAMATLVIARAAIWIRDHDICIWVVPWCVDPRVVSSLWF